MSCARNVNITAATQICHRDTSSANANVTAATQICRRGTSSANANITAATQICHRDTSSANANISAARHICHADTSSANANITAATQICHTDTSSANANIRRRLASRGHGGDYPRRSSFRKLCVLPLPRKSEPRPRRRLSAPQLLQEALRTAQSEPRPRRRLSAPQLLQEALRTATATQKRAAVTTATIHATAPSGSSVYCTCHTKASRGRGGDYPRRSSFRKLCVLHLPSKSEPRPRRQLSAPQLLQEALRTAPAKQHVCEMRCVR